MRTSFTKLAVDHYQFTIVIFIMLLAMGLSSYFSMPRTEDPPIQVPGASIVVIYPGTDPIDLEELVADHIEEALNELEDIKRINTTIKNGIVSIAVEFNFSTDADDKFDEVVQQVSNIKNQLPNDIYSIDINQWKTTDVNMLQLAFVSDSISYRKLEEYADQLKTKIERASGIKKVLLFAIPDQEVRISLNIEKMAHMNISIDHVAKAIQSNNANIPGGSLKLGNKSFSIKTSGSYQTLEEIRNTVVSSYKGQNIYLHNIAKVSFDYEDINYYARYNGKRAIYLTVQQKEGRNIFHVWDGMKGMIELYKTQLPQDIALETVFNQTESVDDRINGFIGNLVQGIILVGIFIFLSLGYRESFMVIIAIPLSILMGLGFIDLAGFGLQQISIAGLVIALGLLVDNSIVIVENIERFIRNGHKRKDAAIKASSQLAWPIVSATVTTLLAFIPIIMMPDKAGMFIKSLPVTVIFTLLSSLLIALSLTPYLSSIFLKKNTGKQQKKNLKTRLQWFITGPYRKTLSYALENRGKTLSIALAGFGISLFIFFNYVGVSYFPKSEKPQLLIRVTTPESMNIDMTNAVARDVENVLDTIDFITHYASNVGRGNPRIYYNIFPRKHDKNYAELFIHLKEYDKWKFDKLVHQLRNTFHDYPGAKIKVKVLEQGPPISAPLEIKVTGKNIEVLREIANDIEAMMEETKGTLNVSNDLSKSGTDIYIDINKDKASMLGVPVSTIDQTVRTCINGSDVSKFRDQKGKEYDIVLRLPFKERIQYHDFDKIYVKSLSGKMIPLRQMVNITFKKSPGIVTHYNMERSATLSADILDDYTLDEVVAILNNKLQNYAWPNGYHHEFTGEIQSREETFGGMQTASLIALIAIFAVLVLQFRSFKQPLIIFVAIPLAVIGSVLALFITGYAFSFTAFIGLISLIGIVVNNSIILVDYTNMLLNEGKGLIASIKEAAETRFTPIILTTLTTIGGLLPLTLQGGSLWAPLGWTIIGGLLVSTMLTLFIVPVLYHVFNKNTN